MKLQTQISLLEADNQIDYTSKILLMGSCFSENIGHKFHYYKFNSVVNPFGIIFNPISIKKIFERAIIQEKFTDNDIFFNNDKWQCFDTHSQLSDKNKPALLDSLNTSLDGLSNYLKSCTHVVITLGTSWVYEQSKLNEVVANCHKLPQANFKKRILSIQEIIESLQRISNLIISENASAEIIYTVSPIRHLKDGFVENNRSKSHLIAAIHEILEKQNTAGSVSYFPAYEIVMDELRDYRFYGEDMIHPNKLTIDIIWEKFKEVWMNKNTITLQKEIDSIQTALQHRPFNPNSEAHKKFLEKLQSKIESLKERLPDIEFKE